MRTGYHYLLIGFKLLNNSPQTAAQQYIFSLRGNNSFLYTHVEENSGKGIMEGQLSTNAAPEEVKTILLKQVFGVKRREGGCGKDTYVLFFDKDEG